MFRWSHLNCDNFIFVCWGWGVRGLLRMCLITRLNVIIPVKLKTEFSVPQFKFETVSSGITKERYWEYYWTWHF